MALSLVQSRRSDGVIRLRSDFARPVFSSEFATTYIIGSGLSKVQKILVWTFSEWQNPPLCPSDISPSAGERLVLLVCRSGMLEAELAQSTNHVQSNDSVAAFTIKFLTSEGGVGEPEERRRTGGGGFPVYWSPISFRLGRPSRAFGGLAILPVVITTV